MPSPYTASGGSTRARSWGIDSSFTSSDPPRDCRRNLCIPYVQLREWAALSQFCKITRPNPRRFADTLLRAMPRIAEHPFDNRRKFMTVAVRAGDAVEIAVKGAPEVVLDRCTRILDEHGQTRLLTPVKREALLTANAMMADRALRVLASASKRAPHATDDLESDLTFVGLAGMIDPLRPEAKEAVAACQRAGIRVVMITGDQPLTARAIARELYAAGPSSTVLNHFFGN